jgi:hypothetical protein
VTSPHSEDLNSEQTSEVTSPVNQDYHHQQSSNEDVLTSLTENCRNCLSNITFYEAGLISCESAAKALAQKVCSKNTDSSSALIQQALHRLHTILLDNNYSHHSINLITDFLRLLLAIDDGLQMSRFQVILFSKYGLAAIALTEK